MLRNKHEHYCSDPFGGILSSSRSGPRKRDFVMAQNLSNQDWRSLAAQASPEMDSEKLTRIVAELCSSFR